MSWKSSWRSNRRKS
uniref:Uncharacterized protein n=1 Tax=Nymphaea colorata TaxID=210225 RepID=A0A5K1EET8_9MAGN